MRHFYLSMTEIAFYNKVSEDQVVRLLFSKYSGRCHFNKTFVSECKRAGLTITKEGVDFTSPSLWYISALCEAIRQGRRAKVETLDVKYKLNRIPDPRVMIKFIEYIKVAQQRSKLKVTIPQTSKD